MQTIGLRGAWALVYFVASVLVAIPIASYKTSDTGLVSSTFPASPARNVFGQSGAWFADFGYSLFGYLVLLLPVIFFCAGVAQMFNRGSYLKWRLPLALTLVFSSGSILCSLHFANYIPLPISSGGLLGKQLALMMFPYVSLELLTLIAFFVFMKGIALLLGFTWLNFAESLGSVVFLALQPLTRLYQMQPELSQTQQETLAMRPPPPWQKLYSGFKRFIDGDNKNLRYRRIEPQIGEVDYHNPDDLTDLQETQSSYERIDLVKHISKAYRENIGPVPADLQKTFNAHSNQYSGTQVSAIDQQPDSKSARTARVVFNQPLPAIEIADMNGDEIPTIDIAENTQQTDLSSQERIGVQHVIAKKVVYKLPSANLLEGCEKNDQIKHDTEKLQQLGGLLESNLLDFGIKAEVEEIHPGPVITRFEISPAAGVKVVRITNLAKDIARSMSVTAVRIVEVIPGKSTIGIEIPNPERAMVRLSQVVSAKVFNQSRAKMALALGYDIQGKPVAVPLEKMPHLLVAGTTGSGKSVGVNSMLLSLLYRLNPEELRLLLIDPKMLELSVYNGIPHLLAPVVTDMKDAANGLKWCVAEMERRYKLMSKLGVRNLDGFNSKVKNALKPISDPLQTDQDGINTLSILPHIVVIIDEFADMIMLVGKKVEELIARIAQKARAAGIHMILATQRPSVDVITGLIKANVPTRIAFQVSSKIDSRTILDQSGAEQLLGHGDMLFLPPGQGTPQRVHGAFVSDEEVHRIVQFWKDQDAPAYVDEVTADLDEVAEEQTDGEPHADEADELFEEAVNFIYEAQRVSISMLQRKFKIGYNRAARIIETMEEKGIVSEMESNGKREILK